MKNKIQNERLVLESFKVEFSMRIKSQNKNLTKVLQLQHFFDIIIHVEKYTHIVSIKTVLVCISKFFYTFVAIWRKN